MAEQTLKLPRERKLTFRESFRGKGICYALSMPFMVLFCAFTVLPVIISLLLSFTSFNVLEFPKWVGLDNYFRLFLEDDVFIKSIGNTLVLAVATGPGGYLLCLIMAWFINELTPKVRAVVTLVFYAPSISGSVFLVWTTLFSGDEYGWLNGFLLKNALVTEAINWLKKPEYMMAIVIGVALWASLGASFLTFIAGFQGIDKSLYEASAIDGIRNRWQELWFVTLPAMRPQLIFGAVMSITGAFGVGGITTALCGNPSQDYAVHTMMNHLEDYGGVRYEMGYASAIATLLFLLMIGSNKVIQKMIAKVGD